MGSEPASDPHKAIRGFEMNTITVDATKFMQSLDSMTQALCPGAVSAAMVRTDTPSFHRFKGIYEADRTVFKVKRVRAFLREAITGEFDYSPNGNATMEQYPELMLQTVEVPCKLMRSIWKYIPRLWVLVTAIDDGIHKITTEYRGDHFWDCIEFEGRDISNFESSKELSQVLTEIQKREGVDPEPWKRFCQKYWDLCAFDAAKAGVAN
jgi:hypothetical protein